jgi:hypothetical protein
MIDTGLTLHDPQRPADRFVIRPILVPTAIALVVGTVDSVFPGLLGYLFFFMGLIALPIGAIVVTALTIGAARRRYWRRTASLLAVLLLAWPMMLPLVRAGDDLHLVLLYPYYKAKIGDATKQTFVGDERRRTGRYGSLPLIGLRQDG